MKLTREKAHMQINVISLELRWVQPAKLCKLINEIFDEHESQVNHLELELMKKSNKCDALQNAVNSLEAQIKNKTINECMIQKTVKETFKQSVVQQLVKDKLISRKKPLSNKLKFGGKNGKAFSQFKRK